MRIAKDRERLGKKMTLIDELKQMKRKKRFVVSIDFVLERLRLMEREDKTKLDQLPSKDSKAV